MPAAASVNRDRPGPEGTTILFVEDEVIISMVTTAMLSDIGYTVLEASSGEKALKLLACEQVDLLVTDYSMPGMTGGQLVKAARELYPGLPVLVATGYTELPEGLDPSLPRISKPYEINGLKAAIEAALGASGNP